MQKKRILALCMAALICVPGASAELKKGDRGGGVLRVQDELFAQGYLNEEGDGLYGKNTAEAVKSFQADNEIEPTGIVDDHTYELLINGEKAQLRKTIQKLVELKYLPAKADEITAEAIRQFQQAHGLEITGEMDESTKALLDSGEAKSYVVRAQERLIELGYLSGKADGSFGMQSAEALRQFQLANGLEATAEADEASLKALFSESAVGDTNRMLQQRLIALGYLSGKADGELGPKSISALKKFQEKHGLEATGENNDATWTALFSDDAKRFYPTLNSASTNADAVKNLQQKLIDLGFLSGKADGDYGGKTYNAVLAFEKRLAAQGRSIETDGEADSELQSILFGDEYTTYIEDVVSGDASEEAKRVENRLRGLKYMDAAADDQFDDYAVSCLKAFQSASGLDATGRADRATIDALFSGEAAAAERYVLHDVRMGESSDVMKYAQESLIRMGFLDQYSGMANGKYDANTERALEMLYNHLIACGSNYAETFAAKELITANAVRVLMDVPLPVYSGDIGADSEENEILRMQRRLYSLFYSVTADGKFGESTENALKAFQSANGLEATGIADEATQDVLFSDSAVGNWMPYMLKVSIADQRVYVYELGEDNQYSRIKTFICSTGLGNATPLGVYSQTTEPLDRWHYFTEFECWAQYAWRIVGPFYFHSVIFDERDEDTLRVNSLYALGQKASHGCVRLKVEDAKWIYQHCNAGTIVEIY